MAGCHTYKPCMPYMSVMLNQTSVILNKSRCKPLRTSGHPGQLLDAHLAGWGVVGYSGSRQFLIFFFPLSLHVNVGPDGYWALIWTAPG